MTIQTTKTFTKALTKLPAADAQRLLGDLERLAALASAKDIVAAAAGASVDLIKLKGSADMYRVRSGDWRMGLRLEGETLTAKWVRHRREAYG